MRIAMICHRPYHLLSAINMVMNDIEECKGNTDLFLLDLPVLSRYYDSIVDEKLFNNVYLFSDLNTNGAVLRKIRKARDMFFPSKSIDRYLKNSSLSSKKYDRIISAGWVYFFVYMCQINPNSEVIMSDDGAGSMVGDLRSIEVTRRMQFFCKLFRRGPISVKVSRMYVNKKALMCGLADFPVKELPIIDDNTMEVIKRVFMYREQTQYKGKKVIMLSTNGGKEHELIQDAIKVCSKWKDRVILRRHPAEDGYYGLEKDFDVDDDLQPWEIVCSDFVDDGTVVVSWFSTAQLTPWIFYGKKPILIFLYNMIESNTIDLSGLLSHFKSKYDGVIHTPISIDEFIRCMEVIMGP